VEDTRIFEASLLPTKNYKSSQGTHQLLEKVLRMKLDEALSIDYGLQIQRGSNLKLANT